MNSRQGLPADYADEQGMAEPNHTSSIPVRATQHVHGDHIKEGESPAHQDMQCDSERACAVAVRSKSRAQNQRQIEAGEPKSLGNALCHNECEGGNEAPEDPGSPMNLHRHAAFPDLDSRTCRSAIVNAVLINPMWVKPCGKFPRMLPVAGSISSPYNPRSFAYLSTR